jgi:hypothetical protein
MCAIIFLPYYFKTRLMTDKLPVLIIYYNKYMYDLYDFDSYNLERVFYGGADVPKYVIHASSGRQNVSCLL